MLTLEEPMEFFYSDPKEFFFLLFISKAMTYTGNSRFFFALELFLATLRCFISFIAVFNVHRLFHKSAYVYRYGVIDHKVADYEINICWRFIAFLFWRLFGSCLLYPFLCVLIYETRLIWSRFHKEINVCKHFTVRRE